MISIFKPNYKYTYKIKHIQALTTPSRQETQPAPSLPREVAQETLVSKISVAESCFETVLPRDHGSEVPVEGVSVAEGRFEGG